MGLRHHFISAEQNASERIDWKADATSPLSGRAAFRKSTFSNAWCLPIAIACCAIALVPLVVACQSLLLANRCYLPILIAKEMVEKPRHLSPIATEVFVIVALAREDQISVSRAVLLGQQSRRNPGSAGKRRVHRT